MRRVRYAAYRLLSRLWPPNSGPGQRALLYHSVGGRFADPYGTSIAPELFRAHIEALVGERVHWQFAPFGPGPADRRELSLCFDDGYLDTLKTAAPLLAEHGLPFTVFVAAAHLDDGSGLYLSRTSLRELAMIPGARIGAHGLSHHALTGLDDARLREELQGSRAKLEDALGRAVALMSYPHGRVDRRVRAAAAAAGFKAAGCSRYGLNTPARDPLLLCRTEIVADDGVADLRAKAAGRWDWFAYRHRDPAG